MKTFRKILSALAVTAAIAGAIYVFATYGDRIAAWARDLLDKFNNCCFCKKACVKVPEEVPEQEEAAQAEEADFEN